MPTSSVQGFRLLHTLAYTCHLLFFSDSHSNRCEEILWLWFGFLSLVILSIIFMYYWPFIYLLWKKISIQFLCLFFKSDFFCVTQLYEFFLIYIYIHILDIYALSDVWLGNIFSYSVGCLCIWLIASLAGGSLLVWWSSTCLSLLCCSCFWCLQPYWTIFDGSWDFEIVF